MKKENILSKLSIINEELQELSIKSLINELKEDIRLETSYKSNSKTKINAIKRVCKKHEKIKPILGGYSTLDGKYVFTDSYQIYCINPIDMPVKRVGEQTEEERQNGIETIAGTYPNIQGILKPMDYNGLVELDLQDIMYHYKIRDTKDINSLKYELKSNNLSAFGNVEFIKNAIDILGKDVKCSLYKGNNYRGNSYNYIVFENEEKETGLVLPIIG